MVRLSVVWTQNVGRMVETSRGIFEIKRCICCVVLSKSIGQVSDACMDTSRETFGSRNRISSGGK